MTKRRVYFDFEKTSAEPDQKMKFEGETYYAVRAPGPQKCLTCAINARYAGQQFSCTDHLPVWCPDLRFILHSEYVALKLLGESS